MTIDDDAFSFRLRINYIDFVDIEIRSFKPTIVVARRFASLGQVERIEEFLRDK